MRFPSIAALVQRAALVLRRYPVTLLLGAVAAGSAMAGVNRDAGELAWRIALVALLGLPLTFGVSALAERRGWRRPLEGVLLAVVVVLLALFFWSWPGPERKADAIHYVQLSAIFHLTVAFLPFIRGPETELFWEYNRRLFESFLRAAVFSAVLFAGLAIALAAVDQLFGAHVPPESYARLWFALAFVVHPWIFLSGVADDPTALDGRLSYPRLLKVFTQYVLTPLVAVYLAIVVAYLAKIVFTGQWPSGWVGYLVTSVAAAGILGFLLVHPLQQLPEEPWIRIYTRVLFGGLVPAAVMLLLALWKRALPYGLTEPRVLGLALAAWLLVIALLYVVQRAPGIRTIPLSLAAVLLVTWTGPFGASRLSVRSQTARLAGLLAVSPSERAGQPANRAVEASGALEFLVEHDAGASIARIFGDSAARVLPGRGAREPAVDSAVQRLLASRGIRFVPRMERMMVARNAGASTWWFSVEQPDSTAWAIGGYRWMMPVSNSVSAAVGIGPDTLRLAVDTSRGTLTASLPGGAATFPLDSLVRALPRDSTRHGTLRLPRGPGAESWVLHREAGGRRLMLIVQSLSGTWTPTGPRIGSWRGMLAVE